MTDAEVGVLAASSEWVQFKIQENDFSLFELSHACVQLGFLFCQSCVKP
jgi:hypothetical protein